MASMWTRLRELWRSDPKGMSLDLLRVGVGLVWALNLLFILIPSNQYFPGFQSVAASFGPQSLGGSGLASFVATYPALFAWLFAILTAYLAVAFLAGLTTRLACTVGIVASAALLIAAFTSTFAFNGTGTNVGPHPLYILIYLILFVGGAGQYVAVDHWIWQTGRARLPRLSQWLASPNLVGPQVPFPVPEPSRGAPGVVPTVRMLEDQQFYNLAAVVAVIVILGAFGAAYYGSMAAPAAPAASDAGSLSYVYLTVTINPTNGMPQYSPANFTVPAGPVEFTIIDEDAPTSWANCTCNVTGTVGGVEYLNGTAYHDVNDSNVAHTFSIPSLGLNVVSPGNETISFTVDLNQTGTYTWLCEAPCGSMGYTGPPMGVPGYMTGTMSVV